MSSPSFPTLIWNVIIIVHPGSFWSSFFVYVCLYNLFFCSWSSYISTCLLSNLALELYLDLIIHGIIIYFSGCKHHLKRYFYFIAFISKTVKLHLEINLRVFFFLTRRNIFKNTEFKEFPLWHSQTTVTAVAQVAAEVWVQSWAWHTGPV